MTITVVQDHSFETAPAKPLEGNRITVSKEEGCFRGRMGSVIAVIAVCSFAIGVIILAKSLVLVLVVELIALGILFSLPSHRD